MFFAGQSVIARRVEQRAAEAFIREEIFRTRDRTGVLIFLSLQERKVLVVGDTGINAKVTKEDWHDVVRRVVEGIRHGNPAEGLIDSIRQCGVLLERRGVPRRPDDRDELADSLRIGDS
jgi:putative membrane protein